MEEKFCNQARAYPFPSSPEPALDAIHVYEQLRDAIQVAESAPRGDKRLLVHWNNQAGISMVVDRIGYFGQAFLVFGGQDGESNEYTALVPAHFASVFLQTIPIKLGESFQPINFMGHSIESCG